MAISKIFLRFNAELADVFTYAKAHQKSLQISDSTIKALTNDLTIWSSSFDLYQNDSTRTIAITRQVRTNYEDISSYLHRFQRNLKESPRVHLTDADYIGLHIHKNKPRRGHIPKPAIAPQIGLLATSHLHNEFEITDPNRPDQNHHAFPDDIAGAGRKLAIVAADATPTKADYSTLSNTGRTMFTINFTPHQEGKRGYLVAWYVNSRGEMGPESKSLSFLIV